MTSAQLTAKAFRVIYSCQTPRQAQAASRYIDLLAAQYVDVDVCALRQELNSLFFSSI